MLLGTVRTSAAGVLGEPKLWLDDPWAERQILGTDSMFVFYVTYFNIALPDPIKYMGPPCEITPSLPTVQADMHPRKIVDSENDVHIVWMRKLTVGSWEIYYAEIAPTDVFKVNPFRISDAAVSDSEYPAIALDSNDDAHVVWADFRSLATWEIFYSKIEDDTGTDLTTPDELISGDLTTHSGRVVDPPVDSGEDCTYIEHPDIAVDTDDNVHIVWSDARHGEWEIYYQKQTNAAIPAVLIDDVAASRVDGIASQCPAIAIGQNNTVHIAWQDARAQADWEVYYRQQYANGEILRYDRMVSGPPPPYDDGFNSAMPDIDVENGPGNHVHIAFMDQRDADPGLTHGDAWHIDGNWEIYAAILNSFGFPVSGNYGVPKRHSDIGGAGPFGNRYTGDSQGDGHSMYPQIAVEDNHPHGETYIKWHDFRHGNWEIYETCVHNDCGNPLYDVRVTTDDSADMYPSIALDNIDRQSNRDPDNKWQSNRTGKWQIYNARKECNEWILLEIAVLGDTIGHDMFPDPGDTDASDGIPYNYGRPLPSGENFSFRYTARDSLGNEDTTDWIELSNTSVEDDLSVPAAFGLAQNYPNPFNPVTEIRYELPADCHVCLDIFDVSGKKVVTLVNEHQTAGRRVVHWDGRDAGDQKLASGIYFCLLRAGSFSESKKMVLLK